ncbi:MAG TPA: hypothetical protein DCG47_04200 [Spirochaetaceae bacterium]|jgi:hypothetical protein|nr:hypothetical protein [Spirochaetaceae bacterium]
MKQVRIILAMLMLVLLAAQPVFAQADAPLTEIELSKFISDWPATVQWLEARGKSLESAGAGPALYAMFAGADFSAFLKGKGWTVERFGYVAGTTFMLVAYIAFELQNPDMLKEFDRAIAEIRADTSISAADKASAINSLEEVKKSLLALPTEAKLNEAEIKLVRAKYDTLKKILATD